MNEKIHIDDWLELKPYDRQTATDSYYLKLCNKVKDRLLEIDYDFLNDFFDEDEINLLSCFLVSYFEDIISETNIWTSFVELHKEMYDKFLPFYDTTEYYLGEINEQDIRFLIWYFFNTIQEDIFFVSNEQFFYDYASVVYDIFDEVYEYAPENEELKKYYKIDKDENNFYEARNLIDTILFNTYLFYTDTLLELRESEISILNKSEDIETMEFLLSSNRDEMIHRTHTRLLCLTGKEWAAKIIGKDHPLSKDFLNMSQKITGFFLYKGQDKDNIFIEHIASGKKFNLKKDSFEYYDRLNEIDTILLIGIVKWKDEWWFSGLYFQLDFNKSIVLNEKNSVESRSAVNFLDHQDGSVYKELELQLKAFKDFNNGSQIAFLPSNKIEDFIQEFTEFFNQSLNLSEEEIEIEEKRVIEDGIFKDKQGKTKELSKIRESGIVFFNPNRGIEIAFEVDSAFPTPENKYFKEENSQEDIIQLLIEDDYSPELVNYCIDNFKTKLPFFQTEDGKELLKDFDFLLRFWKKNNYHSVPLIINI